MKERISKNINVGCHGLFIESNVAKCEPMFNRNRLGVDFISPYTL